MRFDAADEEEEALRRLAELVQEARTSAGPTQAALAARLCFQQSVISAIESGAQVPPFGMMRRIARALDRTLRIEVPQASRPVRAPRRRSPEVAGRAGGHRYY